MQDVSFYRKLGEAFGKHKAREGYTEEPKFDWENTPEFEGLTKAQQIVVEDAAKLSWSREWVFIRASNGNSVGEYYAKLHSNETITEFARHIGRAGRSGTSGPIGLSQRLRQIHH